MAEQEFLNLKAAEDTERQDEDHHWKAAIDSFGEHIWLHRIEVYGETKEQAEALRDRILWALENPIHPELFQYQDKENPDVWHNCADVGEVVRAKANGHNTRGLYLKKPLIPN